MFLDCRRISFSSWGSGTLRAISLTRISQFPSFRGEAIKPIMVLSFSGMAKISFLQIMKLLYGYFTLCLSAGKVLKR
jgi:hypothetical protein